MEESRTSLKNNKCENRSIGKSHMVGESESNSNQKISTRSFLSTIGSKLFSGIQTEPKKAEEKREEKKEAEEKIENSEKKSIKEEKKSMSLTVKTKKVTPDESWRRSDRDFLEFKTNYNCGIGKIMRNWMGLIYCILILRFNLIKLFQENLPDYHEGDALLQKQLREENLTVFRIIRKAQAYSQERSLFLWTHLEKLMYSRMLIKNALNLMRTRDANKDWKGAAAKLAQVEEELAKVRAVHEALATNDFNEELARLEEINATKGKDLEKIIDQISALKKKEVQMRGRILLNMKNYKDLSNERKHLLEVQKDMNLLKCNQTAIAKEYASRIQAIKNQIEENEKQIKLEKEEIKKLRLSLDVVGDASLNSVATSEI